MSDSELHITIAAAPNLEFGNPRLLEHDLRLAKSAILYADKVTLCSATAWISASFFIMGTLPRSEREQIRLVYELYKGIGRILDPEAERHIPEFERYVTLINRSPNLLTKKERVALNGFRKMIFGIWENLGSELTSITRGFGFDEIESAVDAGVLDIHPFTETMLDNFAHEYFGVVQNILNGSVSHPLLDEQTGELVLAALREGKLSINNSSSKRSKQTGLVTNLFDRLPIFDAPMEDLLDLRKELSKPLASFRSKIIELSSDVENAPWDKDFQADLQQTYNRSVEPALIEIEDELKSVRFQDFWARRLVDKAGYLGIGASASYALGAAVAPVAGIVGAFAGMAVFVKAGLSELENQQSKIERNGLYFYYKLRQQLSDR